MTAPRCVLQNDFLSLEVAPLGAEMQSLRTSAGDDLLWNGDATFWSGRAPVLFPIVGRAVDDVIAVADHKAPMSQHGFARRSLFALQDQTDVSCSHILTQNSKSMAVYPFDFTLKVTHRLERNTVQVTAQVQNNSAQTMPFGFGFHPAFCWPLPNAGRAAHYVTLATHSTPDMHKLDDGLLDPQPLPSPFVEGKLAIDEDLFTEGALVFPNGSEALRYGPAKGLTLEFQFHNLPDLALWRPKGAPFLCIEPWHGTASYTGDGPQISQRPNSIALAPEAVVEFGYEVTVRM